MLVRFLIRGKDIHQWISTHEIAQCIAKAKFYNLIDYFAINSL